MESEDREETELLSAIAETTKAVERLDGVVKDYYSRANYHEIGISTRLLRFAIKAQGLWVKIMEREYGLTFSDSVLNAVWDQEREGGLPPTDLESYERKKYLVKLFNTMLRKNGVAIRHPETGRPCNLYAVASDDKRGRYVLEDRETKKRSHSSKSLRDMLPFKVVAEVSFPEM